MKRVKRFKDRIEWRESEKTERDGLQQLSEGCCNSRPAISFIQEAQTFKMNNILEFFKQPTLRDITLKY